MHPNASVFVRSRVHCQQAGDFHRREQHATCLITFRGCLIWVCLFYGSLHNGLPFGFPFKATPDWVALFPKKKQNPFRSNPQRLLLLLLLLLLQLLLLLLLEVAAQLSREAKKCTPVWPKGTYTTMGGSKWETGKWTLVFPCKTHPPKKGCTLKNTVPSCQSLTSLT